MDNASIYSLEAGAPQAKRGYNSARENTRADSINRPTATGERRTPVHRRLNLLVRPLKSVPLPVRVLLAALLLVGGMFGALPILGFWMIPLALLILSLDFRWARRGYLGIILWFRRRKQRKLAAAKEARGGAR